jgi:hypothetical protein
MQFLNLKRVCAPSWLQKTHNGIFANLVNVKMSKVKWQIELEERLKKSSGGVETFINCSSN